MDFGIKLAISMLPFGMLISAAGAMSVGNDTLEKICTVAIFLCGLIAAIGLAISIWS